MRVAVCAAAGAILAVPLTPALDAQQSAAPGACRISGKAASTATPLPGVSIVLTAQGSVKAVTSTDIDGTYHVTIPAGTYTLTAWHETLGTATQTVTVGGSESPAISFVFKAKK